MRIPIFFVESREICPCPECQSSLKHRDYRLRVMKLEGGKKMILQVERLVCTNAGCRRLHNAIPDCLVPYKHYASEVISGVLDDVISPYDTEAEDYPCESTMLRWKHWLMMNYLRIDGYLKSIGHRILGFNQELLESRISLLEKIRLSNDCWLSCQDKNLRFL